MNTGRQGSRGSGSGVEEGGGWREEEDCRRVEDVPKGEDVKGPGEGERVIHFNCSLKEMSQTEKDAGLHPKRRVCGLSLWGTGHYRRHGVDSFGSSCCGIYQAV